MIRDGEACEFVSQNKLQGSLPDEAQKAMFKWEMLEVAGPIPVSHVPTTVTHGSCGSRDLLSSRAGAPHSDDSFHHELRESK